MTTNDLIFQLGYLVLACLGLWQLSRGLNNWRVLLSASAWPQTEATLLDKELLIEVSTQLVNPSDYIGTPYYHEIEWTPFYQTLSTRYVTPLLRFSYTLNGETIETNNLAAYNHKFVYLNREEAQNVLEQFSYAEPFIIAYHPQKAGEIFLGREHFPYGWAILQTVVGLFFTLGFTLTIQFVLMQLGLQEPRIAGRVISIYLIPLAVAIYFGLRVIASRMV